MSPAYRAHPEFGYFCLSSRFRRRVLIALAVMGFGAFAGTQGLRSGHETADAGVAVIAPVRATAVEAETIPVVKAPTPATEAPARPEGTKSACAANAWTYLDGKCDGSRRKPHGLRGAIDSSPIATIPLGRSAPPPAVPPTTAKPERLADASGSNPNSSSRDAVPGEAVPLPTASPVRKVELAPEPAAAASAATEPTEQSASPAKGKLRAGRGQNSGHDLEKGNAGSRDGGPPRSGQRSARADASAGNRAARRSSTGWAGQLRAGEQILRAFLSAGI
jgi:hypothetical protein